MATDDDFGPLDEPLYDPEFDGVPSKGKPGAARPGPAFAAQRGAPATARSEAAVRNGGPARGRPDAPAAKAAPAEVDEPGFDPGDEPTDEVIDAAAARQSVEQQAIESLRQSFTHVEKIADL